MKKIITLFLLLSTIMGLNAQMMTKKEAIEIILKNMVGLEYYSPVVGETGYKKIDNAEINSKDMFLFKDKAGKELFWFNIEDTTISYESDALSIWYGYYNYKVKSNKNTGSKISDAFDRLKKMDHSGAEMIPLKDYDEVKPFTDGLAAVGLNEKYGFINQQGKEIIPLKYDHTYSFHDRLAAVTLNGKHGFIDQKGNVIIPLQYDNAYSFFDGLAPVSLNKKFGFIDQKGNIIIPLKYDHAYFFTNGLAAVNLNGKHGYINQKGDVIIPLKYDDASPFSSTGIAGVEVNGKQLYIDKTGKEVTK